MDKILFYEPFFKPASHIDINEVFDPYTLEENLIITDKIRNHLSHKEIQLTTSLLNEIKQFKTSKFNIFKIEYLIIHTIGCHKRIVFKNTQGIKGIVHIFLIDYYVHDLIKENKEEKDTFNNLFKVLSLGTLFGIFSYFKN